MNQVSAQVRTDKGKGASRRLRHTKKIPGIVYGAGKAPVSISLEHDGFAHAIENESFFSQLISLTIAEVEERVILKDMQRHPYKSLIMHVDFQRIDENQLVKMSIPLAFLGEVESPGVKSGGTISHNMNNVDVECLPKDIPAVLEVDVSRMQVGELVHLSNINTPDGVHIAALKYGAKFDAPVASLYKGKK